MDKFFQPNMLLEVLAEDSSLIFMGRIERFFDGVLQLANSQDSELPPAMFGTPVKLRGFSGVTPRIFVGQVCGNSPEVWKIDHLEPFRFEEQRSTFRQRLNTDAKVMLVTGNSFPSAFNMPKDSSKYIPCNVVDISTGGVQISCHPPLGVQFACNEPFEEGARLFIADLHVAPDEDPFCFTCCVRRRVEQKGGNYAYGCQIEDLSTHEQDRLTRNIFIVQRNELHKRRSFGD